MSKPKTPNEIIKSWTQEDWDRIGDKIAQDMEKHFLDLKAFKASPRFQEVLEQIKQQVLPDQSIGDNVYQEPLFGDVSNEEFIKVFSVVFTEELSGVKPTPVDAPFYTEEVVYEGLKFFEIHGQGTAFIVQGPEFKEST